MKNKKLYLFFFLFLIENWTLAQQMPSVNSTCDTFTIKGYTICLVKYSKKTKMYNAYYGFCANNEIANDSQFSKLIIQYSTATLGSQYIKKLVNIPRKKFTVIKNKITRAIYRSTSSGVSVAINICDTSVRNYAYYYLYDEIGVKKAGLIPFGESFCFGKGAKLNKSLINIEPMTLNCIELLFPSFHAYYSKELDPKSYSHPFSFCAGYYKDKVEFKEIKMAFQKDGKYHLLVPIFRIE